MPKRQCRKLPRRSAKFVANALLARIEATFCSLQEAGKLEGLAPKRASEILRRVAATDPSVAARLEAAKQARSEMLARRREKRTQQGTNVIAELLLAHIERTLCSIGAAAKQEGLTLNRASKILGRRADADPDFALRLEAAKQARSAMLARCRQERQRRQSEKSAAAALRNWDEQQELRKRRASRKFILSPADCRRWTRECRFARELLWRTEKKQVYLPV